MGLLDIFNGKTEIDELKEKIALWQGEIAQNQLRLDSLIDQIRDLKSELSVTQKKYEAAHGAEKNMLAAKIKPLLQQLKLMDEKEIQISAKMKDFTLLIHNAEMRIIQIETGTLPDDIEEAAFDKEEMLDNMAMERKASNRLSGMTLQSYENDDVDARLKDMESDKVDPLLSQLNDVLGTEKEEKTDFDKI